jgi:hypothetical protein
VNLLSSGSHVYVADMFDITLYEKKGEAWGGERKTITLGPWNLDIFLRVESFRLNKKECGFFAMITKRVWLYVAIDTRFVKMYVFDAKEAGMTWEHKVVTENVSLEKLATNLGAAIKSTYIYEHGQGWRKSKASRDVQSIAINNLIDKITTQDQI